jgi:hypothetical protein
MPEKVEPGNFKAVEVLIRDIQTLANRARILRMVRTANALNGAQNVADWEFAAQVVP